MRKFDSRRVEQMFPVSSCETESGNLGREGFELIVTKREER